MLWQFIVIAILVGLYFSIRSHWVFNMDLKLLMAIYEISKKDISEKDGLEKLLWRLKTFDSVSFFAKVYKFWKPVTPEAFYKDMSFLQEPEVK